MSISYSQTQVSFQEPSFDLDATIIDLCLSIFSWAVFRKRKGAIKLHYLYDHSGSPPSFMAMTDGKHHDVRVARDDKKLYFALLPDSILSVDLAYLDYKWLWDLNKNGVFFVTRSKRNLKYEITGQHQPINNKHVIRDDVIRLRGYYTSQKYPESLRLVGYTDPKTGKYYEFLTNNFTLAAKSIADIYKSRWQIELFFKWIKQT